MKQNTPAKSENIIHPILQLFSASKRRRQDQNGEKVENNLSNHGLKGNLTELLRKRETGLMKKIKRSLMNGTSC